MSLCGRTEEVAGDWWAELSDLVKLRDVGALTSDEYEEERQVIVGSMRKLQNRDGHEHIHCKYS